MKMKIPFSPFWQVLRKHRSKAGPQSQAPSNSSYVHKHGVRELLGLTLEIWGKKVTFQLQWLKILDSGFSYLTCVR